MSSTSTPAQYLIRRAVASDAAAIHALIVELAEFERAKEQVTNTAKQLESDGFADPNNPHFTAFVVEHITNAVSATEAAESNTNTTANGTDHVVGFALCFPAYSTWKGSCLYLEDLYVSDAHRKQGLGLALLDTVVRSAQSSGMARVMFQALDWNISAVKLYESLGAVHMKEWLSLRWTTETMQQFVQRPSIVKPHIKVQISATALGG